MSPKCSLHLTTAQNCIVLYDLDSFEEYLSDILLNVPQFYLFEVFLMVRWDFVVFQRKNTEVKYNLPYNKSIKYQCEPLLISLTWFTWLR